MRFSKIVLGLGVALAAVTAAQAAKITVDYRHDYRTDYGQNFDRICFIAAFDNGVGFYVDSSLRSGSEGPLIDGPNGKEKHPDYHDGQWGDFGANAVEMSLWYSYKIGNTGFTITPGIITETAGQTGYKPYLRLQYNTDMGLWFAIRPRYDYWRNDGPGQDTKNARLDAWVGYNQGNFGINYNYTYIKAINDNVDGTPRNMYDGKDHNYEHNIAVNYRMGQWNPYFEIGDIADAANDGRQARIRLGVQYTF